MSVANKHISNPPQIEVISLYTSRVT